MHWLIVPIAAVVGAIVGPILVFLGDDPLVLPGILAFAAISGATIGCVVGALGAFGYSTPKSRVMKVMLGGAGLLLGWTLLIVLVAVQGFAPDLELVVAALVSSTLGVLFFKLVSQRSPSAKRPWTETIS